MTFGKRQTNLEKSAPISARNLDFLVGEIDQQFFMRRACNFLLDKKSLVKLAPAFSGAGQTLGIAGLVVSYNKCINEFSIRPCETGKFSFRPYRNDYRN